MALENENGSPFTMPVQPMYGGGYGNNGGGFFGGDWAWIILLLLIGGGGWGFGGGFGGMMWPMMMGGMNGFGLDYLYPWLNNSQHISDGFRDQQLQSSVNSLQNSITSGFGDVQLGIAGVNQNICQTGNGIVNALNSGFNSAEVAANSRQMANMQQAFAAQTAMAQGFNGVQGQLAQCCCDNKTAALENRYALATEACATRTADAQNTNTLLTALNNGIQSIKDELCNDRLEAERRDNANLRSELMYAREQASRLAQSDSIVDRTYARFKDCPVNTVSVYGNQPVWTCAGPNLGTGCGCNGFNAVA